MSAAAGAAENMEEAEADVDSCCVLTGATPSASSRARGGGSTGIPSPQLDALRQHIASRLQRSLQDPQLRAQMALRAATGAAAGHTAGASSAKAAETRPQASTVASPAASAPAPSARRPPSFSPAARTPQRAALAAQIAREATPLRRRPSSASSRYSGRWPHGTRHACGSPAEISCISAVESDAPPSVAMPLPGSCDDRLRQQRSGELASASMWLAIGKPEREVPMLPGGSATPPLRASARGARPSSASSTRSTTSAASASKRASSGRSSGGTASCVASRNRDAAVRCASSVRARALGAARSNLATGARPGRAPIIRDGDVRAASSTAATCTASGASTRVAASTTWSTSGDAAASTASVTARNLHDAASALRRLVTAAPVGATTAAVLAAQNSAERQDDAAAGNAACACAGEAPPRGGAAMAAAAFEGLGAAIDAGATAAADAAALEEFFGASAQLLAEENASLREALDDMHQRIARLETYDELQAFDAKVRAVSTSRLEGPQSPAGRSRVCAVTGDARGAGDSGVTQARSCGEVSRRSGELFSENEELRGELARAEVLGAELERQQQEAEDRLSRLELEQASALGATVTPDESTSIVSSAHDCNVPSLSGQASAAALEPTGTSLVDSVHECGCTSAPGSPSALLSRSQRAAVKGGA
eukprot:TRINITY_DN24707_c0_g1_i2.p1 TRINITY_DN24707_c0_g1~~TRINITY_DN24707_c0_g1_i2.p1  ORF type:complete len:657 (-),score=151.68 TRINITY_DN24707_c0_g1_i2:171-2141(-)